LLARHRRAIHVITNGYDPEEYDCLTTHRLDNFTITYTGHFHHHHRDPALLFDALKVLSERSKIILDDISVCFFGEVPQELDRVLSAYNLRRIVKTHAWAPRKDTLQLQRNAHILLHLSHANEQGILTGKLFEYLGARRPILSIPGDKRVLDELLQRAAAGRSYGSVEEVAAYVYELYQQWQQTGQVTCLGDETAYSA
jgi:glycosyltransferase involved in cell wall biosynthesis